MELLNLNLTRNTTHKGVPVGFFFLGSETHDNEAASYFIPTENPLRNLFLSMGKEIGGVKREMNFFPT